MHQKFFSHNPGTFRDIDVCHYLMPLSLGATISLGFWRGKKIYTHDVIFELTFPLKILKGRKGYSTYGLFKLNIDDWIGRSISESELNITRKTKSLHSVGTMYWVVGERAPRHVPFQSLKKQKRNSPLLLKSNSRITLFLKCKSLSTFKKCNFYTWKWSLILMHEHELHIIYRTLV